MNIFLFFGCLFLKWSAVKYGGASSIQGDFYVYALHNGPAWSMAEKVYTVWEFCACCIPTQSI
jgi:hypothetical protein